MVILSFLLFTCVSVYSGGLQFALQVRPQQPVQLRHIRVIEYDRIVSVYPLTLHEDEAAPLLLIVGIFKRAYLVVDHSAVPLSFSAILSKMP